MKYRLINKNIADMVSDESFFTHRELFRGNSARDVINYVEKYRLRTNDLSVITVKMGNSITLYSFNSMKWIK